MEKVMLTEDEKEHIRAEEVFRHEIQQQYAKESGGDSRFWKIINSGFFLWFMSTIIVGIVSFSYSNFDKRRQEQHTKDEREITIEQEKRVIMRKIDAEVSNRLYYFAQLAKLQGNKLPANALFILEKPASIDYPVNVFPEFMNRNLQSLLWELLQVVPEGEKKDVEPAYKQARELSSMFLSESILKSASFRLPESQLLKDFHANAINAIVGEHQRMRLQVFNLERWGNPLTPLYASDKATDSGVPPNNKPK
jgi:hypothetical protein